MRFPIRRLPVRHSIGAHDSVLGQHRSQCQSGEPHAQVGDERPAMNAPASATTSVEKMAAHCEVLIVR
jgi:hypothetical protein